MQTDMHPMPPHGIVADHERISSQLPIGLVNPHDHRSTFSDI
jgi:hypothetical protein